MSIRPPHLVYLGWERPAIDLIAERLLRLNDENPEQFRRATIVVPTRESSRSLRETLAEHSRRRALLIPRIILPSQILPLDPTTTATAIEQYSSWFCELNPEQVHEQYPALFPTRPATDLNADWQFSIAEQLQQLRFRLDDHLISPADIISKLNGELAGQLGSVATEEAARWASLNTLFTLVDARLGKLGKISRAEAIRRALGTLHWSGACRLMILACLPQLPPYLQQAVAILNQQDGGTVEAWVHAPENLAGRFTPFGQPTEAWVHSLIELEEHQIHVEAHEKALAKCAVSRVAQAVHQNDTVTLGVCDTRFTPALEQAFARQNWALYDPSERKVSATDLAQLPGQLLEAAGPPEKATGLDALMRNQVMLRLMGVSEPESCCRQLDDIAQTHFPESAQAMQDTLERLHQRHPDQNAATLDYLLKVRQLVKAIAGAATPEAALLQLAALLRTSFSGEDAYSQCATELAATLESMAAFQQHNQAPLGFDAALTLISRLFRQTVIQTPGDRSDSAIDALGWLELPYATGKHLILTGMHEGCVPETSGNDPFLPDTLCRAIGLDHAASRLARDSYLFNALLASHPDTEIIIARNTPDRTPITPSKLLLRCGDHPRDQLATRVNHLFINTNSTEQLPAYDRGNWYVHVPGQEASGTGENTPPRPNPHAPLEPLTLLTPCPRNKWTHTAEPLTPSLLKSFLSNPLRFWLKHEFGLSPWDAYADHKNSTSPLDTGNLIHDILHHLTTTFPDWREDLTANAITTEAHRLLETSLLEQFGDSPPLSVQVLKQQLTEKLAEFAYLHAEDLRAGWSVLATEHPVVLELDSGLTLNMRIDRIDRHSSGAMRVIDYKAHSDSPEEKHLKTVRNPELYRYLMGGIPLCQGPKRTKRWVDVQLPLYGEYVRLHYPSCESVTVAYYNIPIDDSPIAYTPFDLSPEKQQSALETARKAAMMIRQGLCLVPTEPFDTTTPSEAKTFGGLSPEEDLRRMLNLPPLPDTPPTTTT